MARRKPQPAVGATLLASPDDVEARFYEAMQQGDLGKIMTVWADDEEIVCVHPGGPRLVGPVAIRASFEAIFANAPVPVRPEQVRRLQTLGCAVHHLVERIVMESGERTEIAWVFATNVYVPTPQGWRLVAHHASPGSAEEMAAIGELPSTLH
jgi:uncharacterized protein (TIGR02246 family)